MKRVNIFTYAISCLFFIMSSISINSQTTDTLIELQGKMVDSDSNKPLVFADLVVNGSNISTITNNDGEFLLKIPMKYLDDMVSISHLGYEKTEIKISALKNLDKITLSPALIKLSEINILNYGKDAKSLVIETLARKSTLYNNSNTLMTAFYRETIKKRRQNASLSEAVFKIHKQPYNNLRNDYIELVKARKKIQTIQN